MLMALRHFTWRDILSLTFEQYLHVMGTMYANQPRVKSWFGWRL
jgi:hypothetical protein